MKQKKMFVEQIAIVAAMVFFSIGALGEDKTVNASSFGWNAEDATAALQAAFDSGANKVIVDRQAGDWISRPLFITNSNIEVVLEDGVTLKAKRGEFHGKNDCLITITRKVNNIVLRGEGNATLAMNKADYHDPKNNYSFSEWRNAVSILKAQNVTVKDLAILSSGGDGVYVSGPKGVILENLKVRDNHRQGMSPISVEDMTVRRCSFMDTYGTAPQCGIDMEPNKENGKFINVIYEDCEFGGNRSHGISLYFAHFSAHTKPVSITFRRCRSYGNGNAGLSFTAGVPFLMEERGQVRGTVRFEDCTFANNGAEALKIFTHSTNGMDVSFADCVFDARGSRAESAMFFSNIRYLGDFGGLAFERCTVKLDEGKKVCIFEAQRGIGIGGKFSGELAVERGGVRETFDLGAFAAKHVPRPEQVSWFKAAKVDFKRIKTSYENITATGKFTPFIRKRFVYVVSVPETGEYKVRFNSKLPRKSDTNTIGAIVQLLDKMGTDLGKFDVPVGDFEYKFNAHKGSVYRFEVASRNGAVIRVACDGAAGALLADMPIQLHDERNVSFRFSVPAEAEVVTVRVEPGLVEQVELVDASGMKMAGIPYQKSSKKPTIFNVKRSKTATDEIWNLKFGKIASTRLQVGVDAIPLLSVDPEYVLIREKK